MAAKRKGKRVDIDNAAGLQAQFDALEGPEPWDILGWRIVLSRHFSAPKAKPKKYRAPLRGDKGKPRPNDK